jgi:pseudaminic acid synthase
MAVKPFSIQTPLGKRTIGPKHPVFIVAEISANHNQSYERAKKLIDAAVYAGVDAVKLQTYTPDTLTINCNKKWFRISSGAWKGKTLYELYKEAYTPWEWQPKLKKYAEKRGIALFSTPFDTTSVDFLEKINVPCYKIASYETSDLELLTRIGKTKKPVIISRGLTDKKNLTLALKTLRSAGAKDIAVLHCVLAYPSQIEQMNLSTIPDIAKRFKVITGLSDHSLGITASIASVALGASIIEKHITLSRKAGGPDATFSLEPKEFKALVQMVRDTERAIGKPTFSPITQEKQNIFIILIQSSSFIDSALLDFE